MNKKFQKQGDMFTIKDNYKSKHAHTDSEQGRNVLNSLVKGEGKYHVDGAIHSPNGMISYHLKDKIKDAELPSGIYRFFYSHAGPQLETIKSRYSESTVEVETDLIKEIKSFLKNKKEYKKIGALYKRGYLLYGPPGTGKTTLISQIINTVIPKESLIIYASDVPSSSYIKAFEEDKRLKVFIFEEMTQIEDVRTDHFLNFIDGNQTVSNAIYIGTTNYPELLPANIIERPGRFDVVRRIDDMPMKVYKSLVDLYCKDAWGILSEEREKLSVAQLMELGLKMKLNKISALESYELLLEMKEAAKREFSKERAGRMGF